MGEAPGRGGGGRPVSFSLSRPPRPCKCKQSGSAVNVGLSHIAYFSLLRTWILHLALLASGTRE